MKRQSDASLALEKQLKSVTFFIDRSLGKKTIPNALKKRGLNVVIHDDYFPPDAKDEVWLKYVAKKQLIVITKDKRIKNRKSEIDLVMKNNVKMFVVRQANLTGEEIAKILIDALVNISKFIKKIKPPFIATITRSGNLSKIR